jgi:hypothetical protein
VLVVGQNPGYDRNNVSNPRVGTTLDVDAYAAWFRSFCTGLQRDEKGRLVKTLHVTDQKTGTTSRLRRVIRHYNGVIYQVDGGARSSVSARRRPCATARRSSSAGYGFIRWRSAPAAT